MVLKHKKLSRIKSHILAIRIDSASFFFVPIIAIGLGVFGGLSLSFASGGATSEAARIEKPLSLHEAELFHSKLLTFAAQKNLEMAYVGPLSRPRGKGGMIAETPGAWRVGRAQEWGSIYLQSPFPYLGTKPPPVEQHQLLICGQSRMVWIVGREKVEKITALTIAQVFEEIEKSQASHYFFNDKRSDTNAQNYIP